MISINGKVLTNQEVIEILEKETGSGKMKGDVEFCLLENYQSMIRILNEAGEARWARKYQASYGIVNQYTRRNFETGGEETIIYYTTVVKDPQRGDRYHTDNLNKVVFHNGYLIVRPGQEDLLLFMRLNERNKTNKWWSVTDARGHQKYLPTQSFNYKEIIPEVESEQDYELYHTTLRAQAMAVNKERIPEAKALEMAIAYGMVDARFKGDKAVRLFLAQKAQQNPEAFIKDLESSSFELRGKVNTAFMYGILAWDMPYVKWGNRKEAETRICTVPAGKDHVDYFVFWLREVDKSGVLQQINSDLDRATMKEHGIELKAPKEDEYKAFLAKLGVSSLDEAKSMIRQVKTQKPVTNGESNTAVLEVAHNLERYTKTTLAAVDKEVLVGVAKHFGIKGAHLFGDEKLVDTILEKGKVGATA